MAENKPDPPKRSLTAYFRFRAVVYDDVKTENTTLAPKEIMSLIGKMWRELDDSEKEKYQKQYDKGAKVYKKKMEAYVKKYGAIPKKKRK